MKTLKIGLLPKILISIVLGVGVGILLKEFEAETIARIFVTINGIFSQFLGFIIPLIIVGLVTPAISDIGKTAGKMLGLQFSSPQLPLRHPVPRRSGVPDWACILLEAWSV